MPIATLEDKHGIRNVRFKLKDAFSEGEEAEVCDIKLEDSKIKTPVVCKIFKDYNFKESSRYVRKSYEFLNQFERLGMNTVPYRGILTGDNVCALVLTDLTQFGPVIAEQDAIRLNVVTPQATKQMSLHYNIGSWNDYALSQLGSSDVHMLVRTLQGLRAFVTDVSLCEKVDNEHAHLRSQLKVNKAPKDSFGWEMRATCAILLNRGEMYLGQNIKPFASALFPDASESLQAAYYQLYKDLLREQKKNPRFLTTKRALTASEYIADTLQVRNNVQFHPFQIPKKPIVLEVAARHFLDQGYDRSVTVKIAYEPKQIMGMTFQVLEFEQNVKPSQVLEMRFKDGTVLKNGAIQTDRSFLGTYIGAHPKNWVQLRFNHR